MQVSGQVTSYGPPWPRRASTSIARSGPPGFNDRGPGGQKRSLPQTPEQKLNEGEPPRTIGKPLQTVPSSSATKLAVLDLLSMLDAGTARSLPPSGTPAVVAPLPAVQSSSDAHVRGMVDLTFEQLLASAVTK